MLLHILYHLIFVATMQDKLAFFFFPEWGNWESSAIILFKITQWISREARIWILIWQVPRIFISKMLPSALLLFIPGIRRIPLQGAQVRWPVCTRSCVNIWLTWAKRSGATRKASLFLGEADRRTNKTIYSAFKEAISNMSQGRIEAKSLNG